MYAYCFKVSWKLRRILAIFKYSLMSWLILALCRPQRRAVRGLHKPWYLVLYEERKPFHDLTEPDISYQESEAIF